MLKFRFIKTRISNKIPRGGGQGVQEGLGMAKSIDFHIANFLLIWNSITLVFVMHVHSKILKEIVTSVSMTKNRMVSA